MEMTHKQGDGHCRGCTVGHDSREQKGIMRQEVKSLLSEKTQWTKTGLITFP
jgi:hypothetical protein